MNVMERKPNIRYRPPQPCLDLFWVLCEDDDEKRVKAAIQLAKMIESVEEETEREAIRMYCVGRLIKGLGSQRLLARIGFSIGLAALLRALSEVKTGQVLEIFQKRMTTGGKIASKSERIRAHVGRILAMSAIVQAGRLANMKADSLEFIVDELLLMPEIRISLLPVCCKVLEDIVGEVSEETFVKHVWPKLASTLGLGWEGCTLDRISLLLICKGTFPGVVNKAFIKKYWGTSLFCEDNDAKLLSAIRNQDFTTKSAIMRERVLPHILSSGRDALSIWKGIGEKMMFSAKDDTELPRKERFMSAKQLFALDLLCKMVDLTTDIQKILALIYDANVVKILFMDTERQKDGKVPLQNKLVRSICSKLKDGGGGNLLGFVTRVLELEKEEEGELAEEGKLTYIHHSNFRNIVDMMDKREMERYVNTLIKYVKGKDKGLFFSKTGEKKTKQMDWCLRQLQHACCSQAHSTQEMQQSVLSLFIRISYFHGLAKTNKVLHCDFVEEFSDSENVRNLCESSLFKCLDQLSTMNPGQASKKETLSHYTELLSSLINHIQSLRTCKGVELLSAWSEETQDVWSELLDRLGALDNNDDDDDEDDDAAEASLTKPAFRLLYLYMGLTLMENVKATTEALKDIFICHDKSQGKETEDDDDDDEDSDSDKNGSPHWVEVLTEILLQLVSHQSHLARVVAATVFRMILPRINAGAVTLILQILNPDKMQEEEMFEDNDGGDDDEVDEEGGDDDEDDDDEEEKAEENGDEEGEDNEKSEDEEDDDEDEDMEVDEQFRSNIKAALGKAAVNDVSSDDDEDDDEEDAQSDMSDSEMFRLDRALVEVFRQRRRVSKKGREEKRREMVHFKMRVLDLLDVLIKSDRLGDFLIHLPPALLVLMAQSSKDGDQAACNRAKASFSLLRNNIKGVKSPSLSEEDVAEKFQILMELASTVKDESQIQPVAAACAMMVKLSKGKCIQVLQDTLSNVIQKKQSKPLPSFFISLLDANPVDFLPLCKTLLSCLKSDTATRDSQVMACTMLTTMVKKGKPTTAKAQDNSWMEKAATVVCKRIHKLDKDKSRGLFVKELLALTLALLLRTDALSVAHFNSSQMARLREVRSKMGTDNKRTVNKIFAALDRLSQKKDNSSSKKRKADAMSPSPKKKGKKSLVEDVKDE